MNQVAILYQNDEIFVIDKPAGLAVQGGQGVAHSLDVDFAKQVGQKVYLVHRLDKDTSGLMIVAKTASAAGKWTNLIGSKVARKEYVALCAGLLSAKNGVIKDDIVQHGENKAAVTHYQVEREWSLSVTGGDGSAMDVPLTLVRLKLETGRMHQIRIHLAKNGCPIAGDDQHGNFKINKLLKKACGIKRLQLASVRLTIPLDGKECVFELPVPFAMDKEI